MSPTFSVIGGGVGDVAWLKAETANADMMPRAINSFFNAISSVQRNYLLELNILKMYQNRRAIPANNDNAAATC